MNVTKIVLLALLISFANTSFAQRNENTKVPYISRCGIDPPCFDCNDTVARFNGNLKKYMAKQMNWRALEQITGVVVADVAIDINGKACLHSLFNHTFSGNNTILELILGEIINKMPNWKPAIKNGQPVNSIRTIAIYSFVKEHPTFDVAYIRSDRNIKWEPSRTIEDVRRTIGTSEVDNTFEHSKDGRE